MLAATTCGLIHLTGILLTHPDASNTSPPCPTPSSHPHPLLTVYQSPNLMVFYGAGWQIGGGGQGLGEKL
ncbi:hypothetical protein Acr_07g0015120 [Actinidia rufa]|uniref:Uncharacterized protein n=1 Tax=Actinidia rufa TaxID=165716 RepID=A0A7J0EYP8_9ERIC|nr:hypothetical protein Acr_07g0015120 [Actinidia rufa]